MIHLPVPCHEDWQKMKAVDGGRHCGSCNKVLPDFSSMSDEQITAFIQRTGTSCGHFRADQVQDGTTYGGWKFYGKWKAAVALLVLGSVFLVSCRRQVSGKMSAYGFAPAEKDNAKTEQKFEEKKRR